MADRKSDSNTRRHGLVAVDSSGGRQPFLRGMITHDLVQRGLDFDAAYAIARAIRGRLVDREEVTTAEIRDLIQERLDEVYGDASPIDLNVRRERPRPEVTVVYHGQPMPFSRGLLARSLYATGLDLDRAYRLVSELEGDLRQEKCVRLTSDDVARRVGELLERQEGHDTARRYWTLRRIHHLPRPIIVYVGGASGTGKSTLSLELGPLLRVYRVTATDTIRQMMRMVFSPEILPALHSSSFEIPTTIGTHPGESQSDLGDMVVASFEEQATRVLVGVRAVVERAIAENMSMLIEGVHLYPPLIPFADLEGAAYQVPLILAMPDAEVHRRRFLTRARFAGRRAERYLANFEGIREIHDFLLDQAEQFDVPWLESNQRELPIEALRLLTGMLQRKLPRSQFEEAVEPTQIPPTMLLIIDGLADRPVRALGQRTPLQAAETPVLDRLARDGRCGLADPISPGVVPDTAAGSLALFGQSPMAMKRGPVEALGAGMDLQPGDIALRANFATLDPEGRVIDRRAGRIREKTEALAKVLDRLPLPSDINEEVEIRVRAATEHRLAIVLRGAGLSSAIQGSDPGEVAFPEQPLTPGPMDPNDEAAVRTARILALFEQAVRRVLAKHPVNVEREQKGQPIANAILTRGAGRVHHLIPLRSAGVPLRVACVAGDRTILGLARWLGAEILSLDGMTANLDTDLALKFKTARRAFKRADLVIVHVKGADIAAHDQRPDLKVAFLERLDSELGRFIERFKGPLRIAIGADHATLSESGQHAADPLPVVIWGEGIEADRVEAYDEQSAAVGGLHRFPLQMLLGKLFDIT